MRAPDAHDLLSVWDGAPAEPDHVRLGRLLALAIPDERIDDDTLGRRNQRLIALYRLFRSGPIEAVATCPTCGTDNEFDLPDEAIASATSPDGDLRIDLRHDGRTLRIRLPRMGDLAGLADLSPPVAEAKLVACCAGPDIVPSAALIAAMAAAFERADPAGLIRLPATCAECATPMTAEVDLAAFVAGAVEQEIARHLGEIDTIARAYGWTESEILALPPGRRARYVALLSGAPRRRPT